MARFALPTADPILPMHPLERFDDIRDLYETNRISEARKYLALGWRLLKVVARRDEGEYASYILGWPVDLPAEYPNEHFVATALRTAHTPAGR